MTYAEFKQKITETKQTICREVYRENQENIRIKKEKTAIKNFEIIFDAVFKISYTKGFQAMSMRDLSRETGLSMGALYGYFKSKDELLEIIQRQGRSMVKGVLVDCIKTVDNPMEKLSTVIKTHIYLSEMVRPWFFFTFMEARNLCEEELKAAQAMESYTEQILVDILELGETKGVFKPKNHRLTASLIKAMQQDWYLKRWKYKKRNITVDEYADYVISCVTSFCLA
ncbi:MAG: TetR/AcrR family transcriptional regulator [Proteobacteria bacterium]|nr:TetR/AcrR family transcriptional regulator [Pseudomonadota bacterium]